MKIAVFTDAYLGASGGIPTSTWGQKQELERLGHEVILFSPATRRDLEKELDLTKSQNLAPQSPQSPKKLTASSVASTKNATNAKSSKEPTNPDAADIKTKKSLGDLKEQLYKQKNIVAVPSHPHLRVANTPVSKRPEVVERFVEALFPEFDFDVVHVQYESSCSLAGMRLARKHHVPLVQTMHGREDIGIYGNIPPGFRFLTAQIINLLHKRYIPHPLKVKTDNLLAPTKTRAKMWEFMISHANYADKVITPSKHFARKLKHYGVTRSITQVSNGVFVLPDVQRRDYIKKTQSATRENPESPTQKSQKPTQEPQKSPLRLIWNSRISHEKRFLPLLEALSLMSEPYSLSVYGDGNQLAEAKRVAKERDLNVKFFGNVDNQEIFTALQKADLGVLMSYGFDNQPMTILEAESVGLPVLLVDPDMKEVATDGGTILVPNENAKYDPEIGTTGEPPSAEAVAKTLDNLARHPEKLQKMSDEMLAHREEIAERAQVEKLLEVYRKAGL